MDDAKAMNVEEGQAAILAKMKAERPTLRAYLRRMRDTCAKCDAEWEAAGAIPNSRYWRGQWYAYRDIERMLEQEGFAESDALNEVHKGSPRTSRDCAIEAKVEAILSARHVAVESDTEVLDGSLVNHNPLGRH